MTAQQRHPPVRDHRENEAGQVLLRSAKTPPIAENKVSITIVGNRRIIRSNSISKHDTGRFPGSGNPNHISVQDFQFSLPLNPIKNPKPQIFQLGTFGVGVNGVILEPQAAEWYRGKRGSEWQYDALGGALSLGFDEHVAHVQPNGTYHYHGLPAGLLSTLKLKANRHSPLVGWALDGFPIYALFAKDESGKVVGVNSGYVLKEGRRPVSNGGPGGHHDGAFVADYVYKVSAGNLDACNGRYGRTPEFPSGTYAYFLTDTFPIIPRCFYGTPVRQALAHGDGGRKTARHKKKRPNQSEREASVNNAASKLGVSVERLRRALGAPPPNFSRAARQLGISEQELQRALHP